MAGIDALSERRWIAVDATTDHPLQHLVGKRVGPFRIGLLAGPRSRVGARFFRLYLENGLRQMCAEPVIVGLAGTGQYPSQNWIEVAHASLEASFGATRRVPLHPDRSEVGRELWQLLGDSVPPGGHVMVEYESEQWQETAQGLAKNYPAVTTPLGHLLFRVGCGVNFKDWYFSEGLLEGPRKLQGCKALNEPHRRRRAIELARELQGFLARQGGGSTLEQAARRRARAVLPSLLATA